ncbi:MAG: MFS transporter [Chloroflexota bacterium]
MARLVSALKGTLWVFLFAHLSHHLCTGILVPLLPFIRDHFVLNYFRSGLLVSVFQLTYGLAQVPMGRIADRRGKHLLIILGLAGIALSTLAVGLSDSYYQLMAFLVLIGICGGTYHPSSTALLAERYPQARRGSVMGIHLVGGASSFIITPVLAGLIAQAAGWRGAFMILSLPALLVSLLFWYKIRDVAAALGTPSSSKGSTAWDLRGLVRVVGILVSISVVSHIISAGVVSFLPLYLVDKHGVPPTYAAMLVGLVHGAGILGAPSGGALSDKIGRKPVIMMSVAAAGPLLYLLTVLPFGPGLLATFVALGVALTSRTPVMESLLADVVPRERLAGVMGLYFFLSMETSGISTPVVGYLMDSLGLNTAFALLAILAVAASGLVFLIRSKV